MQYRHEYKHVISPEDYHVLRSRLSHIMHPDRNSSDSGGYRVRSLYFDNIYDKVLIEKITGVNNREKFRIRLYNNDDSFIRLEKKSKRSGLCNKQSASLSADEVQRVMDSDIDWMSACDNQLIKEFYFKMKTQLLRPMAVVDYLREAYVFPPGNVRVTFDSDIRTGVKATDFLNPQMPVILAGDKIHILEVKYDNFLPSEIRNMIQIGDTRSTAFSKYAAARIYG